MSWKGEVPNRIYRYVEDVIIVHDKSGKAANDYCRPILRLAFLVNNLLSGTFENATCWLNVYISLLSTKKNQPEYT